MRVWDKPDVRTRVLGSEAAKILEKAKKYSSPTYFTDIPLVVKRARGCIVEDMDGNKYLDFNAGAAVTAVGHCHPKVIDAVKMQCEKLFHYSPSTWANEITAELGEKINEIAPGSDAKKVFYCCSGAESVEGAIKLSRWHSKRPLILAFIHSFHGRTYGALSCTASKIVMRERFFPLVPGVVHVPSPYCYRCAFKLSYPECDYWCVDFIREELLETYVPPEEVAGIIFEAIQGEGGYIVPPPNYFGLLKKLADEHGFLFIEDGIQTGIGRTGKWFATEHWNVVPDILCIAKGIASGLPLGAIVAKSEVMDWTSGSHGSTFAPNPICGSAALATIQTIKEERLVEKAAIVGEYALKRCNEMMEKHEIIGDVRGKGLMIGIELVKDRNTKKPLKKGMNSILLRCFHDGVIVRKCGANVLRIMPPLTITRELVDVGLDTIDKSLSKAKKED